MKNPTEVAMMHLGKLRKRRTKANHSLVKTMEEQVKSNLAWRGSISLIDAKAMLAGQGPFTYILSEGFDKNHYFLHYVSHNRKVHHKNIRIRYENGVAVFRNGGSDTYNKIVDLIPSCLQCSQSICKPLV